MIPQILSHYCILSKLGAGGMGEVYLAQDTKLNRKVAIKILPQNSFVDDRARKRFIREAQAIAKLDHPNICTIHEVGEESDQPFIVMQYIDGETLASRIQMRNLTLRDTLDIAVQVASALAEAHFHGMVHRDIKPSNIIVNGRGQAKLLDFGLAKVIREICQANSEAETQSLLTAPGTIIGTVAYMSPEQIKGEELDGRSDVFSFGAMVYEMVSGRRPFDAGNAVATISATLTQDPSPLAIYSQDVPAELEQIVIKALRKNKGQRYQTIKDLLFDLNNLRDELRGERGRQSSGKLSIDRIESLAVLPLDNLSGDPTQEYFTDGMTDVLITELAKIGAFKVISRTSVMQYKKARKSLPEIARELKIDAIVEGSALRSGDRVRITAQLLDARTDHHLWAETYERDLRDILAIQSEVARAIANEVRIKLTPQEQARLVNIHAINPVACEAYLKGIYYFYQGRDKAPSMEAIKLLGKSFACFDQAIEIEPDYAAAYSSLARSYHHLASYGIKELFSQSKAAAIKALQMDDKLAEAHAALGYTLLKYEWDWPGAEREHKRAIELSPSYSDAHHGYALCLAAVGHHTEAIREIKLAEELDPLSMVAKINTGQIYACARDYSRAKEYLCNVIALDPNITLARWMLGSVYTLSGEFDEALAEFQYGLSLSGGDPLNASGLGYAYALLGRKDEAQRVLDQLQHVSDQYYWTAYQIAIIYAGLGEKDRMIEWLEKAYEERSDALIWLKVDPRLDMMRSDGRFTDLVRRVGLPQ